jgi:pimeloyl-ACP methyl ester carboxylesterase
LDEDESLTFQSAQTRVTVTARRLPNPDAETFTKSGHLVATAQLLGHRSDLPIHYTEVDGLEAAYMDMVEETSQGRKSLLRLLAINAPDSIVLIVFGTPMHSEEALGGVVETLLSSLTWTKVAPVPRGDMVAVKEIEQPLVDHHRTPPELRDSNFYEHPLPRAGAFSGFEQTAYASEVGQLAAYWTPITTAEPGPAVVYVEGGFGGPTRLSTKRGRKNNDQSARVFADAGLVVMVPSFRGEAGNPGVIEYFYGETLDLLAAVDALAARPDVDPERIYLVGHSTGGTHVLNAAVAGAPVRAAFSLGGRADLVAVAQDGGYGVEPFSLAELESFVVRSPNRWASQLSVPTYYCEGEVEYNIDAMSMAVHTPMMQGYLVPNADHFSELRPVKQAIARHMLADTGRQPGFEFSEGLLYTLTR